jgi:hypothetical protein
MADDFGFKQFLPSGAKALERACFVALHHGRVADHVRGQNG